MRHLLPVLLLCACGRDTPGSTGEIPTTSSSGPTVTLAPPPMGSRARLAQVLTVSADIPVRATLVLDDGASHQRTVHPPQSGTSFTAAIPGFRQGRTYSVTVTLEPVGGGPALHSQLFEVETETLASPFPELDLLVNTPDPDRGDTIFPVRNEAGAGYLLMVDPDGEVIWALDGGGTWWRTVRLLEGGELLLIADHDVVVTDWADLAPRNFAPPAGTEGYHHEAIPRPGGGFFGFTAGPSDAPDVPRTYDTACEPAGPLTIWDSIVVEADADGVPLKTWSLAERLDTHRIGWNSLDATTIGPDWGHANGMQYLEDEDAFLISMRNQDLVLKLSRATGEIGWILSNPNGWAPAFDALRLQPLDPDFRWTSHQHAPEWRDGRLLIHDNGVHPDFPCATAPNQATGTRTAEFAIDEEAGTVELLWSFENGLNSSIMGDADRLENGRVLTTYGQTEADEWGATHLSRGRGRLAGRLIEFDPADSVVHWDLEVYEAEPAQNPGGFKIPRSLRLRDWWSP